MAEPCDPSTATTFSARDVDDDHPRRSTRDPRRPSWPRPSPPAWSAALRALDADDWAKPTDCPAWDVRAMAGHVLGMTETFTACAGSCRACGPRSKAKGDGARWSTA